MAGYRSNREKPFLCSFKKNFQKKKKLSSPQTRSFFIIHFESNHSRNIPVEIMKRELVTNFKYNQCDATYRSSRRGKIYFNNC